MAQQQVGQLVTWISHWKFKFFTTIGYESASRGPSVPSLHVKNCNLHGNSIEPRCKSAWTLLSYHANCCFWLILKGVKCLHLQIHSWLQCTDQRTRTFSISSLDFSQLIVVPYMVVGSTRRHARDDKFYQPPPLFSCNVKKIREPGDEAILRVCVHGRVSSRNFGLGWKWVWHFTHRAPLSPLTIDIVCFQGFIQWQNWGGGRCNKWVGMKFRKALGHVWEISRCLQTVFTCR